MNFTTVKTPKLKIPAIKKRINKSLNSKEDCITAKLLINYF